MNTLELLMQKYVATGELPESEELIKDMEAVLGTPLRTREQLSEEALTRLVTALNLLHTAFTRLEARVALLEITPGRANGN